jgi:hypothetical protein
MDNLEFLDAPEGASELVQPVEAPAEPIAEQAPEPQPEAAAPPRDEHGRFAARAEAQPAEPVAAQPEPQPEPKPAVPPGFVPISVVQELREEMRSLKAAPPVQPQIEIPDPVMDPEGFASFQSNRFEQARFQDRLYFSAQLAETKYGKDTIEEAHKWGFQRCETDPYFNARVRASQDPYSLVVSEYQREQIASQVSPDRFKAFQAWEAAQAQAQQAPPVVPPQPATPPRSIVSAPSAGGVQHTATGPGVAFDEVIK